MTLSVGPGFWIAQLISGVCIICCLPQFPFARSNVELVFQLCNLVFLLLHILFDLVGRFCLVLSRWRSTGVGWRARSGCLSLWSGCGWRIGNSDDGDTAAGRQVVVGENLALRGFRFVGTVFARLVAQRLCLCANRQCGRESNCCEDSRNFHGHPRAAGGTARMPCIVLRIWLRTSTPKGRGSQWVTGQQKALAIRAEYCWYFGF